MVIIPNILTWDTLSRMFSYLAVCSLRCTLYDLCHVRLYTLFTRTLLQGAFFIKDKLEGHNVISIQSFLFP